MSLVAIILIRLLAPLLILRWPLIGVVASTLADAFDYGTICNSAVGAHNYQYLDKLLDTYFLTFLLISALGWKEVRAKKTLIGLYVFRVIGVLLFFITGQELLLFFFPNLISDFFIFYVLFKRLTSQAPLFRNNWDFAAVLGVMLIPKLFSEFYLHVYHVAHLRVPGFLSWFYSCSSNFQMLVYVAVPVTYLAWRVYRARSGIEKSSH